MSDARRILVTGGCGFIGCNLTAALARRGDEVIVLDNLSRAGTQENAAWLKNEFADHVTIELADVRDGSILCSLVTRATGIFHLAAQVAVTTSLEDPRGDFEVNAGGTVGVLEAVRRHNPGAAVVLASTNKVYGKLFDEHAIVRNGNRYTPVDSHFANGVAEDAPLDFYSPYGCSKGTADQYVRDYARIFGLKTVVLRMSCIYGPRQFGTEDQGWLAHFLIRSLRGNTISIYGDGYQVRDALYIDDAVGAWTAVLDNIDRVRGRVFNLGGGPCNTISLREMMDIIGELRGHPPEIRFGGWRPGDQPWYVSNIGAISKALGWQPHVDLREGISALDRWLVQRMPDGAAAPELQEARA